MKNALCEQIDACLGAWIGVGILAASAGLVGYVVYTVIRVWWR